MCLLCMVVEHRELQRTMTRIRQSSAVRPRTWAAEPVYHSFIQHLTLTITLAVVAWLSGSTLVSINLVTLRRAQLVLGWVGG